MTGFGRLVPPMVSRPALSTSSLDVISRCGLAASLDCHIYGDRFQPLKKVDGSGFGSITGMVAPPNDGLWLSADVGVVHIPEPEIESALQHPEHGVSIEVFDLISDLPEQLQRS